MSGELVGGLARRSAPRILVVGSTMMDLTAYVERPPTAGETIEGSSFALGFGGKGANQAVMATLLGAEVEMVACVGDDVFGRMTVDNLVQVGVGTRFVREIPDASSGVAPIWVDASGQNRIVIVPGANLAMTTAQVDQAFSEAGDIDVVVCQLEVPEECVHRALALARARGTVAILNPAPMRAVSPELLRLASWLIPNETEFKHLYDIVAAVDGALDLSGRAAAVARALGVSIVVTVGDEGALLVTSEGARRVPAPPRKTIDTSGAGDAFVGSFAYAIGLRLPAPEAAAFACATASASVERAGTQSSFLRGAELEELRLIYLSS